MLKIGCLFILCSLIIAMSISCGRGDKEGALDLKSLYNTYKPYTRWWWFASVIQKEDIAVQLDWLKANGFGGVEIAFIYPVNRNPDAERLGWLSSEWTEVVAYAKEYSDRIGLGCDFTFGSLWPFGGTFVEDSDRTKVYGDPTFKQMLRFSWTHPDTGNVLDHMSREAFERYAWVMGEALAPALKGSLSGLFCDSWEVETRRIWTDGFDEAFEERFGYDIRPFMEDIYSDANGDARYDYMKLVAEIVLNSFYIPFTEKCHALGAFSRVQCAGSPTDLMTAFAAEDVPETEAMLYEPNFAKIVASAAALASKPVVSSETFTCLYGWPSAHHLEEQTADLKMVVDALFAHGVNQIFWHGMPYNPKGVDSVYFYATVHVGTKGALTEELPAFNGYMTEVSRIMRRGRTYSDVAVYLPLEDAWMAGEYPKELQMEWSWGAYELRYVHTPEELKGYHPLWINHQFLQNGEWKDGRLRCGDASFSALVVDVDYLDSEALDTLLRLGKKGLPICVKKPPKEPGRIKSGTYETRLKKLMASKNVSADFKDVIDHPPLVEGENLPDFWCRRDGNEHYFFFAHPKAQNLTYPMEYGQSHTEETVEREITIHVNGRAAAVTLRFLPYQSILLSVDEDGEVRFIDLVFQPKVPKRR